jgi:hypothetical protein
MLPQKIIFIRSHLEDDDDDESIPSASVHEAMADGSIPHDSHNRNRFLPIRITEFESSEAGH